MNWQVFFDIVIKYLIPLAALVISILAYRHTKKIYQETINKPFTLKILPNGEITFWDSNRHSGTVSINMTFYNSGNVPDVITGLFLVRLDASLSKVMNCMYASEYLPDKIEHYRGKDIPINNLFGGIQLGPKAEKSFRITFDDDREEVFSPGIQTVYVVYKTLTNNHWHFSNVTISCETSDEFFDRLVMNSKSIPLILDNNPREGLTIDNPLTHLWK